MDRYIDAHLVECSRCGLVYAGDLPSSDRLGQHYADYPAARALSELTIRRYGQLLDRLTGFRRRGRLLDVGCGDGLFLVAARQRGWESYGSEYGDGPRARARAQGLDVRPAPFPATASELASFDVVTMIEVIEHVAEPRPEIARVASLLRPGGVLYLTTPNFDSLSRRLLGPNWRAVEYPEHLNMFTPSTLEQILSREGFRKLSVTTTGISPSDMWSGIRAPRAAAAPPGPGSDLDQRLRSSVDSSPVVERVLAAANATLSALGIGDTIKAVYQRL